jgi:cell division protein FtsL
MVLFASAAISHVWTRMRAIECGYKISKASKRHRKLLEVNRRLRIEVTLLKNPKRVARIAAEELGMHHPQPDQIRRLRLRPASPKKQPPHLARAGR